MSLASLVLGCSLNAAGTATAAFEGGAVEDVRSTKDARAQPEAGAPHEASTSRDASTDTTERDAAHDSGKDVRAADVSALDSPPPACSVAPGSCVAALPAGWGLVVFEASHAAPCPSPLVAVDVESAPTPSAAACGCSCDVTTPPVCNDGNLARMVSNDTSCSQTGVVLAVDGPGCTPFPAGSSGLDAYGEAAVLPAVNGACTASPTTHASGVTTTPGRVCTLPTDCEEQTCEGGVPAGFKECLTQEGVQPTCPAGWGSPLVVGSGVDLACSACTCDVNTPSTCNAASLSIFSDPACNTLLATLAIDGTCVADPASGQTPSAFKYSATLTQACTTDGPKTATVSLTAPETLCCKP